MNEERAKKVLQEQIDRYGQEYDAEGIEALDMAIKALEQESITWIVGKDNCQVAVRNMPIDKMQKICAIIGEEEQQPCEDCVSRIKLLGRIDAERRHLLDVGMDGAEHILVHNARRIIEDMPSVKPQRPKGKWIPLDGDLKKCSVCGEYSLCPSKFCCSCGAEMEGDK